MTIRDLIEELENYPLDTGVVAGNIDNFGTTFSDLIIMETNPIGDRYSEDILLLALVGRGL